MDFNVLNLLWAVLVLPITFIYNSWSKRGERISTLEKELSNTKLSVESLKDKIDPISDDIKGLTKTISDAELSLEKRLLSITIETMKSRGPSK